MSLLAPIRRHRVDQATRSGLLRSVRLFRLFMAEQTDPEKFYAYLAEDAVQQVAEHCELDGRTVVDVGGGGGWFTAAFRARGANCYLFEPDPDELEHVPDPMGLAEEMIRVTRPGGLVYLSYTNWYSPWGGHEMSPWHYLG